MYLHGWPQHGADRCQCAPGSVHESVKARVRVALKRRVRRAGLPVAHDVTIFDLGRLVKAARILRGAES